MHIDPQMNMKRFNNNNNNRKIQRINSKPKAKLSEFYVSA